MVNQHQREEEEEESGLEEHTLVAGQRQTFVDKDDVAIAFYIHKSVNRQTQRRNLSNDIQNNGGIVCDEADHADTVIVDDSKVDRIAMRLVYNCRPGRSQAAPIYVEPMSFVQRCIREGIVWHRLPLKQGMGGVVGRSRTPFTEEDDANLSYYLSRVIPFKRYGGRYGNNVYKMLRKLGVVNPEEYAWTKRHPWKSWRERYKKNAPRLDLLIKRYARKDPPSEHGLYQFRRGWSSKHQCFVGPDVSDEEAQSPESESEDMDTEDMDTEDMIVYPETRPPHAKRRRPSSFTTSLPSAALTKRQRTDPYGQEMHRIDSPDFQARSKGKEKAVSPLGNDNNESFHSLFTGDEYDHIDVPFDSPNPYMASQAGPSRRSPSFQTMPQTSQMTLVETNPLSSQRHPTSKDISSLPHPSPNIPRTPPANDAAEMEYEDEAPQIVSNEHVSPPPIHASRQASETKTNTSPSSIGERVDVNLVVSPVPAPGPPAAKKRARRPKPMTSVAQPNPPYRNTRSRSRSVEPSAIPPGPAVSKRTNTRKQKDVSKLEPLREAEQEAQRAESAIPETMATIDETVEEEKDVENLLVATDISGITSISGMPAPDVDPLLSSASDGRSKSLALDTDDEQIKRGLHQADKQPSAKFPTSKYNDMDPKDVLRSFNANLPSTSHSRQSSIRPLQLNLLAQRRRGTSVASSSDRRIVESIPQPRTPVRTLRSRKKSTSSTESFPVAGTRASDTKKKYEQVEKRSPYKPPVGTRAAQHALAR